MAGMKQKKAEVLVISKALISPECDNFINETKHKQTGQFINLGAFITSNDKKQPSHHITHSTYKKQPSHHITQST